MNPSERIELITSIADRLAVEEWSLIDLTLRQFGLPWTDDWDGNDRPGYVTQMIEGADEEALLGLASHLKVAHRHTPGAVLGSDPKIKELIRDIGAQKSLMISVATGGPRIQNVNGEYVDRRASMVAVLQTMGIEDPNPFIGLWRWYGRWSDGSLPTYQSRRVYVAELYQPLLDSLGLLAQHKNIEYPEPTGWTRVDRIVEKITQALQTAADEEDFQAVGLWCREAVISLAQAVYDPELHPSVDGTDPSKTDAKRMIENYIAAELAGGSNEELRSYSKSAHKLASALQHRRNAYFREAALCVEATRSIINIIAIVSGRRDPL